MASGSLNGAPVARWWHGATCAVATAALVRQPLWPIGWLGCTLLVGAPTTWYRCPFLNADRPGYPQVLLTSLVVTVVFLAMRGLVDRFAPPAPLRPEEKR